MASLDIKTFLAIAKAMTPAPVAPVKEIAPIQYIPPEYSKGSESSVAMAKDIEYLRTSVDNIEKKLDKMTEIHVTNVDFNDLVKTNDKAHADFEMRLREQGTRQTQILTWGAILIFLTTLAQIAMKYLGQ